jgi:hypothetical protein
MTLLTNLLAASLAVTTPQLKDSARVENFLDLYSQNATQYEKESFTSTRGKYSLSIDPVKRGFEVDTLNENWGGNTYDHGRDLFFSPDLSFSVSWTDGVDSLNIFHYFNKIGYLQSLENDGAISKNWRDRLNSQDDLYTFVKKDTALLYQFTTSTPTHEVGHNVASFITPSHRGYTIQIKINLRDSLYNEKVRLFLQEIIRGFNVEENKK